MAKDKVPVAQSSITLGPITLDAKAISELAAASYARTGVVLSNERIKVVIPWGEVPCTYTLSLYIQRDAVNDAESLEVAKVKDERDGAKAKREQDEQDKFAREKRAAFQLGQESTMTALQNIGQLAAGVQALQNLQQKKA